MTFADVYMENKGKYTHDLNAVIKLSTIKDIIITKQRNVLLKSLRVYTLIFPVRQVSKASITEVERERGNYKYVVALMFAVNGDSGLCYKS